MDPGFDHWLTVGFERRVLVVVRTVTTLNRLLDVLTLFSGDHRVQTVFTFDRDRPAILGAGVPRLLERLGVAVIPWQQAIATEFDLAIAASENDDLHLLRAPVVLLPHGIGHQKYYPGSSVVAGLNPERLVHHGQVVPALIAVAHAEQRDQLRAASPEAAERAEVVGDPCLDRLVAGAHRAAEYRAALAGRGKRLVTIASTWGPSSVLGQHPGLPLRLVAELPVDTTTVCAILHPGIAAAHSSWQLDAWLAEAKQAGLLVIPSETGWQAAVTASSCVIGDESSVSLYAAALDRPMLMAGSPSPATVPGSPAAMLAARTDALAADRPLAAQIDDAIDRHVPGSYEPVAKQAVAVPGQSAELLRAACYRLMKLPEPRGPAEFSSYPVASPTRTEPVAFVAGIRAHGSRDVLVRLPATEVPQHLHHLHVIAHHTRASLRELSAAAVVFTDDTEVDFPGWAAAVLKQWPDAQFAAARLEDRCLALDRSGRRYELVPGSRQADPLAAVSMLYLGRTELEFGRCRVSVAIRTR
ncbi:hypothetical protein G3I59_10050 [Amycolatopsis rubida]|uniref:Uncharacterized protein n=1 Tax=Amycolatopsis rubida TaxID=112413 RepID=A0ABX0BN63_9PSEU|nr:MULTISPECIES: hypothetical protein [Amycolatopsis]MYW90934.1 hypothetical protein [Amycolatopsis rubida]NEC55919.1 hypothetical protein [Amycolatopsis rubida]OAP25996.1 hypothetical protein A4R44_03373 [Amycolatopsis sp. M39]